jgi:hypothetical protein
MIFIDSNLTAVLLAATQFLLNISVYFILERVWNNIAWGKIIPPSE